MNNFQTFGSRCDSRCGYGCWLWLREKQTGADVAPAVTADDNSAANAAIERAAQAITDGVVYFDFDKSDIKAESRDMLRQKLSS